MKKEGKTTKVSEEGKTTKVSKEGGVQVTNNPSMKGRCAAVYRCINERIASAAHLT